MTRPPWGEEAKAHTTVAGFLRCCGHMTMVVHKYTNSSSRTGKIHANRLGVQPLPSPLPLPLLNRTPKSRFFKNISNFFLSLLPSLDMCKSSLDAGARLSGPHRVVADPKIVVPKARSTSSFRARDMGLESWIYVCFQKQKQECPYLGVFTEGGK